MEKMWEDMAPWASKFALSLRKSPEQDKLHWALNPDLEAAKLDLDETGQLLFILSSYHYSLAAEMGRVYAKMRYNSQDAVSRAKLNIIKPHHDSIELKISVVKKLFDRKVRENIRGNNG